MKSLVTLLVFACLVGLQTEAEPLAPGLPDNLVEIRQAMGDPQAQLTPAPTEVAQRIYSLVESKFAIDHKVAWMDFKKIQKQIHDVQIWINDSNRAVVGSSGRIGSVYLTKQKAVIYNRALIEKLQSQSPALDISQELILMHEFLGALGYPDQNYLLSSHVWMVNFPMVYSDKVIGINEALIDQELQTQGLITENTAFDSGTSVGVGGGGDPASVVLKVNALSTLAINEDYFIKSYRLTETDFSKLVRTLSLLEIEPITLSDAYQTPSPLPVLIEWDTNGNHLVALIPQNAFLSMRDQGTLQQVSLSLIQDLIYKLKEL